MVRRFLVVACLLPVVALSSIAAKGSQDVAPQDRVLGPGAEMRLPSNTAALAETLSSIARASGVLIGFETMLDRDPPSARTRSGWSIRGKKVSEALDELMVVHP